VAIVVVGQVREAWTTVPPPGRDTWPWPSPSPLPKLLQINHVGDGITGNNDSWNMVVHRQCKGKRGKEVTFAETRKQSKESNGASSFDG
jgi:hypothetical protein